MTGHESKSCNVWTPRINVLEAKYNIYSAKHNVDSVKSASRSQRNSTTFLAVKKFIQQNVIIIHLNSLPP